MTKHPPKPPPMSVDNLDRISRSIVDRANVLREEGEVLKDRLESLEQRSVDAIRDAQSLGKPLITERKIIKK